MNPNTRRQSSRPMGVRKLNNRSLHRQKFSNPYGRSLMARSASVIGTSIKNDMCLEIFQLQYYALTATKV